MSWVLRMALVGSVAELVVAVLAWLEAGLVGLAAALVGGGLATSAQVAAVAILRPGMKARTPEFMRRWATGIAIRGATALVVVGLVLVTKAVLPPLWVVLGFFAVLLTLLYAETRFLE
jgi:prolipoprotein diacylglyceryltransferase